MTDRPLTTATTYDLQPPPKVVQLYYYVVNFCGCSEGLDAFRFLLNYIIINLSGQV